jgi:hypothetical protein
MMKKDRWYPFLYYTHLPLIGLAMVLTASISAVTWHSISWPSVSLVGLSTYLTYSIDNLFDWSKDRSQYLPQAAMIESYHRISLGLIAAAGDGILWLTLRSGSQMQVGLLLLGAAAAMGTLRFAHYREDETGDLRGFLWNRIFIAVIWSVVCVFIPVWYESGTLTPRIWRSFIYMGQLIFIFAVLWKFEKSAPALQGTIRSSRLFQVLGWLCLTALIQVLIDTASGLFPPQNLLNALPPLASFAGVQAIRKNPSRLREKIGWLTLGLGVLSALSALIHQLTA